MFSDYRVCLIEEDLLLQEFFLFCLFLLLVVFVFVSDGTNLHLITRLLVYMSKIVGI